MSAIWGKPEGFQVLRIGSNLLQFFFAHETNVLRIERGSPWLFKGFGLPQQFKTLEVGNKLGMRIGSIREVDFFEVRGKESRIVKAYVDFDVSKVVKDNLKLISPYGMHLEVGLRYERLGIVCTYCARIGHNSRHCQSFMEDSVGNRIKQDAIGEWVKANQVGRRIYRKDDSFPVHSKYSSGDVPQPKRKPHPSWLLDGFSNLSMKDSRDGSSSKTSSSLIKDSQQVSTGAHHDTHNVVTQNANLVLKELPLNTLL
ncbi:hypothetical protein PIB30_089263 [Stylosanthes scabra]|uniref:Zinc knuckle CX2CX4HX4C domain-containing protein n=1 Tax=Stylosanthes scabra TaxID=79078 RepID=A0ABU6RTW6_9FABA|nr:hypothetical protein [Stylosanthes scabra]